MLTSIKTLLVGIPLLTQIAVAGGTTAAVSASAVAYSQTQSCHKQPIIISHYDERHVTIAPVIAHSDGTLPRGTSKTVVAGVEGLDTIKHTVTKHCGRFLNDIAESAVTTKAAIAEVKNVGTAYDATEDQPIAYGNQQTSDSTQLTGKTGLRTAGSAGVKRVTYHFAQSEGQEISKTYVSEAVITPPVDEIDWYGTKPPAAVYPTKLSRTGICHAPGTTYYNRTLYYTTYNTLNECLNSGGRLPLR